jgi:hypothetical protein
MSSQTQQVVSWLLRAEVTSRQRPQADPHPADLGFPEARLTGTDMWVRSRLYGDVRADARMLRFR